MQNFKEDRHFYACTLLKKMLSWNSIIPVLLLIPFLSFAQTQPTVNSTLKGQIVDSDTKQGIPGVSVHIIGTTHTVQTDNNGRFDFITGQSFPYTLEINYVGYEKKTFVATGSPVVIPLKETASQLNDVVVVGYGTQTRKSLVGSITKINAAEIKQIPVASFDAQLQGKAAGVQINSQSGTPGEGIIVRVRGSSSINASNDPLYIVDGVFLNNDKMSTLDLGGKQTSPIADINPNDIESIEVLKDASATAIYGSRGANGVVIVTTKKGSYNSPAKVSFNYNEGLAWAPENRLWKLTTGPEHATLVNEQWINSGKDKPSLNQTFANRPFRPKTELINGIAGRGTPEEQQTYDRLDDLFRTGHLRNFDLSLDGGTSTTRYYLGGSYTDQDANIRPVGFKRGSFKLNLDQKVNDKVQVGTTNSLSYSVRDQARVGTGPQAGIFQAALHTPTYLPKVNPDGTPGRWAGFDNLQSLIDNYNVKTKSIRYIGGVNAEATLAKGFKFRTSISLDYNNYKESEIWNTKTLLGSAPTNGLVNSQISENVSWINEQTLAYKSEAGKDHSFGILVGNTLQANTLTRNGATGQNFANDSFTQISAAATRTSSQSWTKSSLSSFFSRADYNFKNKYFLEASIRADGSSRFGANNKWGYFPSIGGAWQLKEEAFLKDTEFISNFKFRTSFGIIGNQNGINDFAALGLWNSGAGYPDVASGGDKPGIAPLQLSNPNLKWEKTQQFDAGIDIGLFKGRLDLTVDVYRKYTTDLLLPVQVPSVSGFSFYNSNAGEISNKGIELSLSSTNIKSKDFTWQTSFNIAANVNKIEKLATPSVYGARDLIRFQEGSPLYSFWMYKQLYVDPKTGDSVFEDVNGDGVITAADRQILGNAAPKFFGGLTNTIRYKDFDLGLLFTYQYGNKIVSFDRILGEGGGTKDANRMILAYNLNRWQKEGDITDVPRVTSIGNNYSIEQNSRLLEDGSFIRLRSLSVGYTLPKQLTSQLGIKKLRVYFEGTNLFLLTHYMGPDPESNSTGDQNARGIDVGTNPQPRTVQLGLSLTL